MDFALAHGKPFAVVPCCVFARDFPHRRMPDGAPKWAGYCHMANLTCQLPRVLFFIQLTISTQNCPHFEWMDAPKYTSATHTGKHSERHTHMNLPAGGPVHSFEQFLAYLALKAPHAQCSRLPLEGANVVLWQARGP